MRLEVVVVPVSDVSRATDFYQALGWRLDADYITVSAVFHDTDGIPEHSGSGRWRAGDRTPGPDPEHRSYRSLASFRDPDGNGWLLQEITQRLPGR